MIFYLKTNGDTTYHYDVPLEYQNYGIGLINISGRVITESSKQLYLCCDIIEESYVGNKKLPILYPIERNTRGSVTSNIYKVLYIRIIRPSISSIRLYICDDTGKVISLGKKTLKCVLLIVPEK